MHSKWRTLSTIVVLGSLSTALHAQPAGSAPAPLEVAKKNLCLSCHTVNKKLVGPSFQDIAEKYNGQADAATKLKESIGRGSKMKYGAVPMPPQPVSDADMQVLVPWILGGAK